MTATIQVSIVYCFHLHMWCITMIHGSACVAMEIHQQACGGHSSTFPLRPPLSSLHLYRFSVFPPHFLSSFCSVILSLLTLPLSLSCTNALSHHRFSSLLSLSLRHTHTLSPQVLPPLALIFHFWWTTIFTPSFSSIPHAHFCCLSDTFCSGFLKSIRSAPLPLHVHMK